LKINKNLQEKLPFSFKSKELAVNKDTIQIQRVAILREPEEAKVFANIKFYSGI
jgi:hypothetical protein